MNRIRIAIIALTMLATALSSNAQTPLAKKACQAVFSLNTFRADGTLISTSHGVFISANGEAVSQWKPFVGASKAVVIDANGKKYDVDGLIGANDLYDLCKFKVKGNTPSAKVSTAAEQEKAQLWLACYNVKSPRLLNASVANVEKFSISSITTKEYPYYIMNIKTPEGVDYCPFVNANGEIVSLMHSAQANGQVNAVSALFPSDFKQEYFGNGAITLSKSLIPILLPEDYKEAQIALLMASQQRKGEAYMAVIEQFISHFPNKPDGYEARAKHNVGKKNFAAAAADMEKMISVSDDKAAAHYTYSGLILDKEIYFADEAFDQWNLDKALNEAQQAYAIDPSPAYLQQEAKIRYAQKNYNDAYDIYMKLQDTKLAGPETMYAATQCKQAAGAPFEEVIVLMDSTISVCPHPLTYQSAPYIFLRGQLYQNNGNHRKAMQEYNNYEKLMVGNQLPAEFYYNRFLCCRIEKMYQQALDDINKAIALAPYEMAYVCEKGSLELRLKMYDEAIATANKVIMYDSRNADAFAILGAAQCCKGQKHEGMLNLEQAKAYGYAAADELIKRYK